MNRPPREYVITVRLSKAERTAATKACKKGEKISEMVRRLIAEHSR